MRIFRRPSEFSLSTWLPLGLLIAFIGIFAAFIYFEKQADQQAEIRYQSSVLIDELRQTSDDLTSMARGYVVTGDARFKQQYNNIFAMRNDGAAHPNNANRWSWMRRLNDANKTAEAEAPKPMFMRINAPSLNDVEYHLLERALAKSAEVAQMNDEAMRRYGDGTSALDRELARELLFDNKYFEMKTEIDNLLSTAQQKTEQRLGGAVKASISNANIARILVILTGLLLIASVLYAYRTLRTILGGSVADLHSRLRALGDGDFSIPTEPAVARSESIMGWMNEAQKQLAHYDAERSQAEARNHKLTMLYNSLSQCNQSIVRSKRQEDLFPLICHDAVAFGGMQTAWVGLIDVKTQTLVPVAAFGNGAHFINGIVLSLDPNDPTARRPCSLAVLENRPVWCNDFQHEPSTQRWHAQAAQCGWQSSGALPLHCNGVVVGSFNLYANEMEAFDPSAQRLLIEMAADISYALANFELEAQRDESLQFEELRAFMLERASSNMPLHDILHEVTHKIETLLFGGLCSILLMDKDGIHLRVSACDSLPQSFNAAIDKAKIGAGIGSCGNSAFTGKRTIVDDIANHPYWDDYREVAASADLGACWSEPIITSNNKILGSFAIYHRQAKSPNRFEIELLEMTAHFVALIIERKQAQAELNKLSQAVEQSSCTILIANTDAEIEYVNQAFVSNTGYTRDEVLGKNPKIFRSDKTSNATHASLRQALKHGEKWHGELINLRKDGSDYVNYVNVAPVRDSESQITHYLYIAEDITERKNAEARIQYLAHYDPLTGLPNRTLLDERAHYAIGLAKRSQESLAVMFFDLDHFKDINDSLGHKVGDSLLIALAERLRVLLRDEDTISRLGGDEFVLVLPNATSAGAEQIAYKLLEMISQPFMISTYELHLTSSVGIAIFPNDGEDLETLSKNADIAMYRAKHEGRNCYRFFTPEMQARSSRHAELLNALRYALDRDQLSVHYQPQISMESGQIIGAEALLRWHHPELGDISPTEFIPIAEENRLILPIGEWVLRTAARQMKVWLDAGMPHFVLAVNLSAVQFRMADLPDMVTRILDEVGLSAEFIELELTEGAAMHEPINAIAVMDNLFDRGVRMSIDDFGTGYSSLNYLKKFKTYKLKIDQSFIQDISIDAEDRAIVSAIIHMAKNLGLRSIAEGVETKAQYDFLREHGCDELQGFFYSQVLTMEQFGELLKKEITLPRLP